MRHRIFFKYFCCDKKKCMLNLHNVENKLFSFVSKLIFGDLKWFWLVNRCKRTYIRKTKLTLFLFILLSKKLFTTNIYISRNHTDLIRMFFLSTKHHDFQDKSSTQVGCVSNSFSGLEIKKEECNQERETNCHEMKFESKARSFFSRLLSAPFFWLFETVYLGEVQTFETFKDV